jgi:hypothetical protein
MKAPDSLLGKVFLMIGPAAKPKLTRFMTLKASQSGRFMHGVVKPIRLMFKIEV